MFQSTRITCYLQEFCLEDRCSNEPLIKSQRTDSFCKPNSAHLCSLSCIGLQEGNRTNVRNNNDKNRWPVLQRRSSAESRFNVCSSVFQSLMSRWMSLLLARRDAGKESKRDSGLPRRSWGASWTYSTKRVTKRQRKIGFRIRAGWWSSSLCLRAQAELRRSYSVSFPPPLLCLSLVIPRPSLDPASRSLGEFLSLSVARLARWRQPVMDWNHGNFEFSVALAPYCLWSCCKSSGSAANRWFWCENTPSFFLDFVVQSWKSLNTRET